MHISKWDLLIYTPVQTQPRQGKVNSVKHALRNAIVVSLQDAQNQRGKRFKSSRANQRLKQKDHAYLIISLNVICLITHWSKLNRDKVKIVKHALRNATVVSLQDAQNQRGKRFKSSRANQRLKHQARRCKKIMHISKWDLIIYTPVQTQPRQGE